MSYSTRRAAIQPNEFGDDRHAVPAPPLLAPTPPPAPPVPPLRDRIIARLTAAGEVLWRCGLPVNLKALQGGTGSWVDVLHDRHDHGAWERGEVCIVRPTAAGLSALDTVFDWLLWLPPEERSVVFARMCGYSFRKIALVDSKRRSRTKVQRVFDQGIRRIEDRLRSGGG